VLTSHGARRGLDERSGDPCLSARILSWRQVGTRRTFSAGYLHLRRETLDELDFPSEDPPSEPIVLKVPGHASFAAFGLALGGELMETGRVSAAVRVMGGPWNDMRHVYLQLSLLVSVLCWDGGGGA
jgi:hypothetical protein